MTSRPAPATPLSAFAQTLPSDAPTGTWLHPRFDEINKRKNASTFSDRNIQTILWNILLFVATLFLPLIGSLKSLHPSLEELAKTATPYAYYALVIVRALPLLGIAYACAPLLRHKDDLSDIPLTPSQRALLGLDPNSRPATPGSHYITPPRYTRSSTPRAGSGSQSGSPYSGRDSFGASTIAASTASFSPTASPLLHKAVGRDLTRRISLGPPTPTNLGKTVYEPSNALVSVTPSPTTGRGASVGLNSRWLYEKGRGSPGLRSVYT